MLTTEAASVGLRSHHHTPNRNAGGVSISCGYSTLIAHERDKGC